MLYIDDIGKDAVSEIKVGKADLSAKLLGDNSLAVSFPFNDLSKQSGTLHLSFPSSDPNAPILIVDASNEDKEKGKIFQFSINNINTGIFRYSAAADLANGIFSLNFPCCFACDLRKDLPLQFDGNLKINFCAKRIPKRPGKLVAAARDLEERAKRFQEQNNLNDQPPNNNNNNPDEIDLNDDRNLNLSLDFIKNDYTYTYYNTFAANGCFTFDFLDVASIKFRLGAATKSVDSSVEPVEDLQQVPAPNVQLFEEEEEIQGDNEANNQREEPQALAEAVENNDDSNKVTTSLSFLASIEGCIAQNLNFIISTNDEKSTNEISFRIPKTDLSFGLYTSIYNGKTGLNSIGTSLIYNAKDGLSRVGFAYDTELGKDNASNSWNLGGGIFRTQLARMVFADFNKGAPIIKSVKQNVKSDKKVPADDSDYPFLARNIERFRLFLCSLRDNLKDTKVFTFASSLAFDFSNNYSFSKFSEGSFGISCNLPQAIAQSAQFQILTNVKQIEDDTPQKNPSFNYSLSTRYSWLATEKTNVSLYAKVSTSKLMPTFGIKIAYKD